MAHIRGLSRPADALPASPMDDAAAASGTLQPLRVGSAARGPAMPCTGRRGREKRLPLWSNSAQKSSEGRPPWQMEGVCRLRSPSPRPAPSCAGLPPERQGPNRGMKGEKKRRQGGRESGAKCLYMPAAPPGARTRTTAGRGLPHTHPTPQPDPPSPCDEPRPTRAPQARTFRSPYIGTPGRVQEAGLVGGNGRSGGRQAGGESLCPL